MCYPCFRKPIAKTFLRALIKVFNSSFWGFYTVSLILRFSKVLIPRVLEVKTFIFVLFIQ